MYIKAAKIGLKKWQISVHFWTEIPTETEILNFAGTRTETDISIEISTATGTEPNFGQSLTLSAFSHTLKNFINFWTIDELLATVLNV